MNKQIKTDEGVIELDERLVELLELNSYSIEFKMTKTYGSKVLEEGGHYCINTFDIEENELGAEDMMNDSEILALYLQQNGYGNIKEFAEKLESMFCTESAYTGGDIKNSIQELVKKYR